MSSYTYPEAISLRDVHEFALANPGREFYQSQGSRCIVAHMLYEAGVACPSVGTSGFTVGVAPPRFFRSLSLISFLSVSHAWDVRTGAQIAEYIEANYAGSLQ